MARLIILEINAKAETPIYKEESQKEALNKEREMIFSQSILGNYPSTEECQKGLTKQNFPKRWIWKGLIKLLQ